MENDATTLAVTTDAVRHNMRGKDARAGKFIDTQTQQPLVVYREGNARSRKKLESIIEFDDVPARAFRLLIWHQLSTNLDYDEVNSLVHRAISTYPKNLFFADAIAHVNLPSWKGKPGDVASYALAHANLYEGKLSDLAYTGILTRNARYLRNNDALDWKSLDYKRVMAGFEHRREMNWRVVLEHWFLKDVMRRNAGPVEDERIMRYFMAERASLPKLGDDSSWFSEACREVPNQIFDSAKHLPKTTR